MRSYERNGVTIDQCTECRGVFLDRGELVRLIDAEAAYEGQADVRGRPEPYDDDPAMPVGLTIGMVGGVGGASSATSSTSTDRRRTWR